MLPGVVPVVERKVVDSWQERWVLHLGWLRKFRTHEAVIFRLPLSFGRCLKRSAEINFYRQHNIGPRTEVVPQAGIGLTTSSQDEHHRPIHLTEGSTKGDFISPTGFGRAARVRVDPDPPKLFRLPSRVDLPVEEISH